jgi:hypothetical protein
MLVARPQAHDGPVVPAVFNLDYPGNIHNPVITPSQCRYSVDNVSGLRGFGHAVSENDRSARLGFVR